jgi:hypothetical protein
VQKKAGAPKLLGKFSVPLFPFDHLSGPVIEMVAFILSEDKTSCLLTGSKRIPFKNFFAFQQNNKS